MTNAFETARENVRNSVSSIFSKSDVLQLLHNVEASAETTDKPNLSTYTVDEVHQLVHSIMTRVVDAVEGFDFANDVGLDLVGNEIFVEITPHRLVALLENEIIDAAGTLGVGTKE
jgi:hypothetical protein